MSLNVENDFNMGEPLNWSTIDSFCPFNIIPLSVYVEYFFGRRRSGWSPQLQSALSCNPIFTCFETLYLLIGYRIVWPWYSICYYENIESKLEFNRGFVHQLSNFSFKRIISIEVQAENFSSDLRMFDRIRWKRAETQQDQSPIFKTHFDRKM